MTNLIWCVYAIILNIIIFIGAKYIHKKVLDNSMLTTPIDEWSENSRFYDQFWKILKPINIVAWVIIIAIIILFHSFDGHQEQADMGTTQTKEEIQEVVPPTKEEVTVINNKTLTEKEVIREAQIADERQKSRDEFNDFLNNSN